MTTEPSGEPIADDRQPGTVDSSDSRDDRPDNFFRSDALQDDVPGPSIPNNEAPATAPPADSAGFPPPGGFVPPPPGTSGYATRYGLVRPTHGRYIAGVCAALGRATNTDPVLWRVALPVLTVLGGLGGLLYIIGWLLIPAEGDTGSPLEALVGRGMSSTSRGVTIALAVLASFGLISGLTDGIGGRFLVLAAIIGGLVLFTTSRNNPTPPWRRADWTMNPPGAWSAPTGAPPFEGPDNPGYRQPFAPHGPYGGSSVPAADPYVGSGPYATHEFPGLLPTVPGVPPMPPVPRRRATPARRITLSGVLLAIGLLGALDLTDVITVPVAAYFAVALATVGLGLIVGSFFGRVRGPVTLGIMLTIGLMIASMLGGFDRDRYSSGDVTWRPATLAELHNGYFERAGQLTVDLRDLDFTGTSRTVRLRVNVGKAIVILPPRVDVTVETRVDIGSSEVLGKNRGGINNSPWTVTDLGYDGTGGGSVLIDAKVNIGNVEVRR